VEKSGFLSPIDSIRSTDIICNGSDAAWATLLCLGLTELQF
jgi:hypothetical protein